MARLATLRISDPSTPGGFLTINDADFDPAVHQRFEAPAEPTPAPVAAPVAPSHKPKPAPKPAATAPKPGAQS